MSKVNNPSNGQPWYLRFMPEKSEKGSSEPEYPTCDTLRGKFYLKRVEWAAKHGIGYEPNEPQDHLYHELMRIWDEIKHIATKDRKKIVVNVLGWKGGIGKTHIISAVATIHKWATAESVAIAEFHQHSGTLDGRLGIDRNDPNTVMVFEFIDNPSLIKDANHAASVLMRHEETSLHVMLAETEANDLPVPKIDKVVDAALHLNSLYPTMFFDIGNGELGAVNEGVSFASDVTILPVMADQQDTYWPSISTMIAMQKRGHIDLMRNAPKVVLRTDPKDTAAQYLKRYREAALAKIDKQSEIYESPVATPEESSPLSKDELVDQLFDDIGLTEENIFLIPHSDYIAASGVTSVLRKNTGILTLLAHSRLLLHIMKMEVRSIEEKRKDFHNAMAERNAKATVVKTVIPTDDFNSLINKLAVANEQGIDHIKHELANLTKTLNPKKTEESSV